MKFSIVTPSFRQLEWLQLCMASIADQTQENLTVEHIIQDGGTPDFSAWIEQKAEHLRSFPGYTLRAVSESDGGMYDAINRGLKKATGDICAYLNCDEQYLPGTLEKVRAFFARSPASDAVVGDALLVDAEGAPLSYRRTVAPSRVHTRLSHLSSPSCSFFFRRSVVDKNLLFDPAWKTIGDAVWVDSLLAAGVRPGTLADPLAAFTFTGSNLGNSSQAHEEMTRWKNQPDTPPSWLKWPEVLRHRLLKFAAGAYQKRPVAYRIFTRESADQRRNFSHDALGWTWPTE